MTLSKSRRAELLLLVEDRILAATDSQDIRTFTDLRTALQEQPTPSPIGDSLLREAVAALAATYRGENPERRFASHDVAKLLDAILAQHAEPAPQSVGAPVPDELERHQPCGCVLCVCEDEERCHGCGAKHCGNRTNHPAYVLSATPTAPVSPRERNEGGGEVVAVVRHNNCTCHPETCCCPPFKVKLRGAYLVGGTEKACQIIADALNRTPAPTASDTAQSEGGLREALQGLLNLIEHPSHDHDETIPEIVAAHAALATPPAPDAAGRVTPAMWQALEAAETEVRDADHVIADVEKTLGIDTPPPAATEPMMQTVCCGRAECGGECGNEWRGMEPCPCCVTPEQSSAQPWAPVTEHEAFCMQEAFSSTYEDGRYNANESYRAAGNALLALRASRHRGPVVVDEGMVDRATAIVLGEGIHDTDTDTLRRVIASALDAALAPQQTEGGRHGE